MDIIKTQNSFETYLTAGNLIFFGHIILNAVIYITTIHFLLKDKLTHKVMGLILLCASTFAFAYNLLNLLTIPYYLHFTNFVYQIIRMIIDVICIIFIFFGNRRWLGFHITFYLLQLLTIATAFSTLIQTMNVLNLYGDISQVISCLSPFATIYIAVLVLIKKTNR